MNIFKNIGNAIKNNAYNIGTALKIGGGAAMAAGSVKYTFELMNSNNNIFGYNMGGCCGLGGMNPYGMMGMNPYSMMGMGQYNMGGCSIFNGCNNNTSTMTAMQHAFMQGNLDYMRNGFRNFATLQNPLQTSNQKSILDNNWQSPFSNFNTNNNLWNFDINSNNTTKIDLEGQERVTQQKYDDVELSENEGNKEKGEQFDLELTELGKNDSRKVEIKDADPKDEDKYASIVGEYGKNYIKAMDKDGDGLVSEDEYVEHETTAGNLKDNENAEDMARVAFRKMDQNRSEKVDWREMSATIATFDEDGSNNKNGSISKADYEKWSELLAAPKDKTFDLAFKENYKKYFKDNS